LDRRPRYPLASSMTRLRRARLAGELVALGIVIPAAVTRRTSSGGLFVVFRSGISPARVGRNIPGQILGSYVFQVLRLITLQLSPKGRFSFTRLTSESWTTTDLPSLRLRLELLHSSRCRLPAFDRMTFPVAVSLNRLATDFLVLLRAMAFGMGRGQSQSVSRKATGKFEKTARLRAPLFFSLLAIRASLARLPAKTHRKSHRGF